MMEDVTLALIIGGILAIVLAPFFAFAGSCTADRKGRSRMAWLVLCGLCSPMLILLFLLPRKKSPGLGATELFQGTEKGTAVGIFRAGKALPKPLN